VTERLEGLAAFLPIFEAPGFSFGEWHTEQGQMPWFDFSPDASRFVSAASQLGRLNPDNFDWVTWKQTDDARRLVDDPRAMRDATLVDLAHLLTTHIRQDRFVEGHLASAFESGHLTEIVRRAEALLKEMDA
jgi:hypothetical protein